jgi:hypothetical protein
MSLKKQEVVAFSTTGTEYIELEVVLLKLRG